MPRRHGVADTEEQSGPRSEAGRPWATSAARQWAAQRRRPYRPCRGNVWGTASRSRPDTTALATVREVIVPPDQVVHAEAEPTVRKTAPLLKTRSQPQGGLDQLS